MPKSLPIFYSALLLTGVNLLLRLVGTTFQVYLSAALGAAGIGLLQLTMSVGSLAMVAGMAGVRTASMYLTAEQLGRRKPGNVTWVLSGCFLYSIVFSGLAGGSLYVFAPQIAQHWIGDLRTIPALRLFAGFLPISCLCGVMTGYFTASNRIGTLAAVEVVEQLCSMAVTMGALSLWAGNDPWPGVPVRDSGRLPRESADPVGADCAAAEGASAPVTRRISVRQPLIRTAVPLALADVLKSGINTTENLMVPRRLGLNVGIADPLAAFGCLSGMVFPVLMFPACILFGLAELLIPELARCAAADSRGRISYLVQRSLKVAMLYGMAFSGLMFLLAEPLCQALYHNSEAGQTLRLYAIMVPMLYCDAITDAMTKGLGQQTACVRYNITTSALDVILLFFLLPEYGMQGYFFSFLITHLINFTLSLRRLLTITRLQLSFSVPALSAAGAIAAVWGAGHFSHPVLKAAGYLGLLVSLLSLFQVIGREDIQWVKGLIAGNFPRKAKK